MNRFKKLKFFDSKNMVFDTSNDTMTNGRNHNDNAFATNKVNIIRKGIVPIPKAYKQWVMMETASLSEHKQRHMTSRKKAQFESRLWSDHRPIYFDVDVGGGGVT